jgi:hypothetical protein
MSSCSRRIILSMLSSEFDNSFVTVPAIGASGGIIIAWRERLGTVLASRVDTYSVSVQFSSGFGDPWWLTCVYGPQGNDDKIAFLQELRDIRTSCAGPWLVGGDFNLIYKAEDKNNNNYNRAMMGRFRRLIDDLTITEIQLHGRKYTRSSSVTGASPVLVRLDRVFCSVDWEQRFPNCLLQSTASDDSDHCPLVLGLNDNHPGKRRFHFECFWPKFEGFHEAVHSAWNSVQATQCPLETLSLKFKATARGLQSWSDKRVENLKSQLEMAREIIHQFEIARDNRQLSELEMWLLSNLKKHSLALSSLLRTVARVRSSIKWLRSGDANTSLFHLHARHRKRKNFIGKLKNGVQVTRRESRGVVGFLH